MEKLKSLKKTQAITIQETENKCKARLHQYPISLVVFAVMLILSAIAFRAVERVFIVMEKSKIAIFEYFSFQPSWKSVELWFLRFGLYKLMRAKVRATDWIVLVDFKVQAGYQKCLIVLGVRLSTLMSKLEKRHSLDVCHEDFEPLALQPMSSSSGEKVAAVLEEISAKTGPFLQVLADHGGDVNKGIKIFCSKYKDTVNTYDIVHKVAILLKNMLEKDEIWMRILKLITEAKQTTKQSQEACLSPPKQREKARFMNADILVDWLQEIFTFLYIEKEVPYLDKNKLIAKLGWVLEFKDTIQEYGEMIDVIRLARHQIRTDGLHPRSHVVFFRDARKQFSALKARPFSLAKNIYFFLKKEGHQIPKGKKLLGSTEGIESIIGRQKVIVERTKATSSITKTVLAIPGMVGEISHSIIKEALESVSVKDLHNWEMEFIGKSDLSKRKEVFNKIGSISLSYQREECVIF
jgi:hypothetical protein